MVLVYWPLQIIKLYKVEVSNIYLSLALLNFFPPMIGMRVTMKPEILSFSLLIWIIYFIEMNLEYKKQKYLYSSIILFGFVLTFKTFCSSDAINFFSICLLQRLYKN